MGRDISKTAPNLHMRLVKSLGGGGGAGGGGGEGEGGTIQERAVFFHWLSETGAILETGRYSREGSNRASTVFAN